MIIEQNSIITLNICIIIAFLITIFKGFKDGFIATFFSLIASILLYFIAWPTAKYLSWFYTFYKYKSQANFPEAINQFLTANMNQIIWYIVIIVLGSIIIKIVFSLSKVVNKVKYVGSVNQISGLALGFVITVVYAAVIGFVLNLGIFSNGKQVINQTVLSLYQYPIQIGTQIGNEFLKNDGVKILKMLDKEVKLSDQEVQNLVKILKEKGVSEAEIQTLLPQAR